MTSPILSPVKSELEGIQSDDQDTILPHSILGSLKDFRGYLEAKGETELLKRIPKSKRDAPSKATGSHRSEAVENGFGLPSGFRNTQGNALRNWYTHMAQRRRQQDVLSDLLDRPVENLVMNHANNFRDTQEQRELLNRVMPLIHSGYGHRVGSEFWSLPQCYGDDMSGIRATLTRTEQGQPKPVTHVAQPRSIRQEAGLLSAETLRPASRTWAQSAYLQQQRQEVQEFLKEMDIEKPDTDGLEVIGSSKQAAIVAVCCSPLLETDEEEKECMETKEENLDPLAKYDDARSRILLIPALRFCGQSASWTGNSTANKGQVGIKSTVIFEALMGESASSHLELHNEGSTAIFYSWKQLVVPRSFPNLRSQTKAACFYFNCSSGVILPGDTQRLEVIFKSEKPGIETELWQLNTHPVLMQGASMQVTLRGVAFYQDNTADQRLFIEMKLERLVMVKLCRSIVYEALQGVRTPERPSSPADLYITEEQEFLRKNPKFQYLHQPVEDLKRLWEAMTPGPSWDLSVDTLKQAVMSLPESTQEVMLSRLNSLCLKLCEPLEMKQHLTAAAIGHQLWRKLLDSMVAEDIWIRNLLDLPEREMWIFEMEDSSSSESDEADEENETSEVTEGAADEEETSETTSRPEDVNKGESAKNEKSVEDNREREKKQEEAGKRAARELETALLTDTCPGSAPQPADQNLDPNLISMNTRLLHAKVYGLLEELVDSLCEQMDELNDGSGHGTLGINA